MAKNNPKAKGKWKKNIKPKFLKKRKESRKKIKAKYAFDISSRLVVRNLSFKTTEGNLKQHFEPYGKILEVKLLKRPNGDVLGTGFVQFDNAEQAKQALNERNNQAFLGRSLQIEWSKQESNDNKKAAVNVSDDIEIKSESESENIDDGKKQRKQKHKSSKNDDEQEDSTKAKSNEEKNKILRKARIVIRNISFKATEESLKDHFKAYGDVLESILLKKSNGDLVGCGFIQFNNVKAAAKAIVETNSKPFLGRPVFVDWAVAKNKYMSYVTQKKDEEQYLKNEVKSEPESDDEIKTEPANLSDVKVKSESDESDNNEDDDKSVKSEGSSDEDAEDSDGDDNNSDEDNDVEMEDDNVNKRVSAHDAEDGLTIFFKNVSFSVTNEDMQEFAKQFGEINYALICVDKLTEHSKGTAFVRFKNKEDADMCFSAEPEKLMLQGQQLQPMSAIFREKAKGKNTIKKEPKDSRNLYLIKEGLILANSKSAFGVSASDMAKRLSLEQRKSDMLKNLNRFISRYRLTIHNIPDHYSDEDLRKLCIETTDVKPYHVKECRIMRHLKGPFDSNGKPMSKGFGFVMFTKHEFALTCLRRMNNNPNIFDKNNRPIVAFSIEDKSVINARKKRMEKSKIKNPTYAKKLEKIEENKSDIKLGKKFKSKTFDKGAKPNNEFGNQVSKVKKAKNKQQQNLKKDLNDVAMDQDFVGEAGKPGVVQKMRSRYKLKMQANMHRENLKLEKKQQKLKSNKKFNVKERIKQPKQKMNTGERKKLKKIAEQKNEKNFTDLVSKYKSKLVGGSTEQKVKSKWYEQS